MSQDALKRRDAAGARSAAKAARAAFQDCEYAEGEAKAAGLEAAAEGLEGAERAAQEGAEALEAGRAALGRGEVAEARRQAGLARERYSREGLGEGGRKGLEGVEGLERVVVEAETKAGHVREGLEASVGQASALFRPAIAISNFVLWATALGRRLGVRRGRWRRVSGRRPRR